MLEALEVQGAIGILTGTETGPTIGLLKDLLLEAMQAEHTMTGGMTGVVTVVAIANLSEAMTGVTIHQQTMTEAMTGDTLLPHTGECTKISSTAYIGSSALLQSSCASLTAKSAAVMIVKVMEVVMEESLLAMAGVYTLLSSLCNLQAQAIIFLPLQLSFVFSDQCSAVCAHTCLSNQLSFRVVSIAGVHPGASSC